MNRPLLSTVATLILVTAPYAQSAEPYVRVGESTDLKCPAHLTLEKGFTQNPEFKLTPDQALAAAPVRCPNKLVVTVFADSENYYITFVGASPEIAGAHVVDGRTGKVSFREPK